LLLLKGTGVTAVAETALGWLQRADGQEVDVDVEQALRWYRRAAARGHRRALVTLGERFRDATNVPQNLSRAIMWFELAGRDGHSRASDTLEKLIDQANERQIAKAGQLREQFLGKLKPAARARFEDQSA